MLDNKCMICNVHGAGVINCNFLSLVFVLRCSFALCFENNAECIEYKVSHAVRAVLGVYRHYRALTLRYTSVFMYQYCVQLTIEIQKTVLPEGQGWANLDQAHEDLDRNIFRDLSPTPKP
jgi:hypothetical protein